MTADTIQSYVRTNLFTDDGLQLEEAYYSNRKSKPLSHTIRGKTKLKVLLLLRKQMERKREEGSRGIYPRGYGTVAWSGK